MRIRPDTAQVFLCMICRRDVFNDSCLEMCMACNQPTAVPHCVTPAAPADVKVRADITVEVVEPDEQPSMPGGMQLRRVKA